MFDKMLDIATNNLVSIDKNVDGLPAPQVTVLLTDSDNIYVAVNDVDGDICKELIDNNDTKVIKMITMWKYGSVDVPSFKFRTVLLEMDENNEYTDILLNGVDGYLSKKIGAITP